MEDQMLNKSDGLGAYSEFKFKKVLVIDDILYIVKSISRILKDEGYFVTTAMTAAEAINKIDSYTPTLITIDQNLTEVTGLELVKVIRERCKHQPRIIFISAVYERDFIKKVLNSGIDHYLIKPFKKAKLLEVVNAIFAEEDKKKRD